MALVTAGEWSGTQQGTNPKGQPDDNSKGSTAPAFAPHQVVVKLRTDTSQFAADNGIVQGYTAVLRGAPVYLV